MLVEITCHAVNCPKVTFSFKNCRMLCINFALISSFLMHWSFSHMKVGSVRIISTEGKRNAVLKCWWSFTVDISHFMCVKQFDRGLSYYAINFLA